MAGHAHHGPALCLVPEGFRAGREARAFDDDEGAAVDRVPAPALGRPQRGLASDGAVGVGERDVDDLGDPLPAGGLGVLDGQAVVVGLDAVLGAVHELVRDEQGARPVLGAQPADRARAEDLADADRAQGPEVGAVVDAVRREVVGAAVAGRKAMRRPATSPRNRESLGAP
ncbi:hypothetical protein SFR_2700 [Streptomyces sp. FR-008]|nr:hypothetical protein SFR_2700 [Streptomyces sp. FR-008]